MQQQAKVKIQDFKPSDQRFNVTVEHAEPIITASPAEGANQRSSAASTATSAQPLIIPHPPGLQIPQRIQSQPQQPIPSQPQVPQQAPQAQPQQPVRSEEKSEQNQDLRTLQRLQRCFRMSKKIISQLVKIRSMQTIKKLNQKKSYSKVSYFRNGIKGIFRDIQQIRSGKLSQKSSSRLDLMVMMHMILFLLVNSVKKNVDPSSSQGGS